MKIILALSLALFATVGCARLPTRPTVAVAASYGTRGYVAPGTGGYGYGPPIVPSYVLLPGTSLAYGSIYDPGTHPSLYTASVPAGSVRVMGSPPPPRAACEVPPCGAEPEVTAEDLGTVVDVVDDLRAEVHALREEPHTDSP